MRLTWRDPISTVLAGLVAYITFAFYESVPMPFITNNRVSIILLAILGIAMCALSGASFENAKTNGWILAGSVLGVIALASIVMGLITGAKVWVMILAVNIISLWVITTVHHVFFK